MAIGDRIKDKKTNREATKVSKLSSGRMDKKNILQMKKYCHLIKVE